MQLGCFPVTKRQGYTAAIEIQPQMSEQDVSQANSSFA